VQKLRALGVRIKGHPKTGYQLERVPDVLVPQLLRRRLEGTPFARRIHHFFRIDSTNTAALQLAVAGEPHGALVLAEEQTAGRGRLGRAWYSEKASGIYLSLILRPELAVQQAPLVTLAAGLAARDAVVEATGLDVDIRWPNDLLVGRKKFCGILTEMQAEGDRVKHVVVGIGVNVNHTKLPAELENIATSLQLAGGRPCSRLELVAGLLRAFDGYYNQLLQAGPAPLIARFGEVSSYASGKRVSVTDPREEFTGTTAGLDSMGCLLVCRDDGEVVPVLAGDVREG
jgi:BirA family biotin operon repressor/biotin-[acetyl-CoA-carboxylase] ligase